MGNRRCVYLLLIVVSFCWILSPASSLCTNMVSFVNNDAKLDFFASNRLPTDCHFEIVEHNSYRHTSCLQLRYHGDDTDRKRSSIKRSPVYTYMRTTIVIDQKHRWYVHFAKLINRLSSNNHRTLLLLMKSPGTSTSITAALSSDFPTNPVWNVDSLDLYGKHGELAAVSLVSIHADINDAGNGNTSQVTIPSVLNVLLDLAKIQVSEMPAGNPFMDPNTPIGTIPFSKSQNRETVNRFCNSILGLPVISDECPIFEDNNQRSNDDLDNNVTESVQFSRISSFTESDFTYWSDFYVSKLQPYVSFQFPLLYRAILIEHEITALSFRGLLINVTKSENLKNDKEADWTITLTAVLYISGHSRKFACFHDETAKRGLNVTNLPVASPIELVSYIDRRLLPDAGFHRQIVTTFQVHQAIISQFLKTQKSHLHISEIVNVDVYQIEWLPRTLYVDPYTLDYFSSDNHSNIHVMSSFEVELPSEMSHDMMVLVHHKFPPSLPQDSSNPSGDASMKKNGIDLISHLPVHLRYQLLADSPRYRSFGSAKILPCALALRIQYRYQEVSASNNTCNSSSDFQIGNLWLTIPFLTRFSHLHGTVPLPILGYNINIFVLFICMLTIVVSTFHIIQATYPCTNPTTIPTAPPSTSTTTSPTTPTPTTTATSPSLDLKARPGVRCLPSRGTVR